MTIIQTILFKWKTTADPAEIKRIHETLPRLKEMCLKNGEPYIVSIRTGRNIRSTPGKDYDTVLHVEFESDRDASYYMHDDHDHVEFVKSALPFAETISIVAIDI